MGNWWNERPWRLIQTNLREIDMIDIDAGQYIKQLKDFGATVVMINTGGILASYPSDIEDHTISEHLTGDSLEKIMDECHKADIKIIARMDFSKVRRPVYEKHPDWAYRSMKGEIIDYNGNVHMCPCGGYLQEMVFEIMKEAANRLPIDGVFMNMGGFRQMDYSYNYYDICHCDNCKKLFKEQFGLELPDKEDMNDIVYRKYKIFQKVITKSIQRRMYDMLKSINSQIAVDGIDFSRIESGTEYPRKEPQWMYNSSSVARCEKSLKPFKVCSNAATEFIGFYYRHVAVSPNMQSLRMWQDVANYIGLDYYVMGRLDNHQDKSGYVRVQRAFKYMSENNDIYKNMQISGDALLIRCARYISSFEACGWIRALTESHILFEESDPDHITSLADIERFKTVIFADMQTISNELKMIMDEYVRNGGCLIITGQTGRYDEEGNERSNIAFESIGAKKIIYYRNDMKSAMFELRNSEQQKFPSLPETKVIYFGDEYIYVQYDEKAEKYLRLIPPHMFGPPEQCYYTQVTDLPGFTVNSYGKGKAIHIPWLPGKVYHLEGYDNTFFFMKDLMKNFAGLETAEDTAFTPMIEVTRGYDMSGTHAMIHLINGTGHFGCSFFEPVEVRDINLRVALNKEPSELKSLVTKKSIPFIWKEGYVLFRIDRLGEIEAINVLF
jgi:hypothetical protein